jgi:hypothetical protein
MDKTRWAAIEGALAHAFRIAPKNLPAFRGRLALLQRGGLLGRENQVGKGTAIEYGRDEAWRLIFAVELLEAGLQPSAILRIVEGLWTEKIARLFRTVVLAEGQSEKLFLALAISLMSDSWSKDRLPKVMLFRTNQPGTLQFADDRVLVLNVAKRWADFVSVIEQED